MKTILSIAGSDSSGGAGIQADLKTFTVHGLYGMSVITAVTAQNTMGVYGVEEISGEMIGKQMDCVFSDIYPAAVKIGMVSSVEAIGIIARKLKQYQAENIVLDTVMVSTSGHSLLKPEAKKVLLEQLLPCAHMITPNIPEAESMTGITIKSREDMLLAAEKIRTYFPGDILIKGGHLKDCADDLFYGKEQVRWFRAERIDTSNSHGTGCTLSSAIACYLAKGISSVKAVEKAKVYLLRALGAGLDLGKGNGPLNHMAGNGDNDGE